MQSEVKSLPKSEILITVSVTDEELSRFEDLAAKHVSEKVEIAGFRKGQAPKAFVISHIGPDSFFSEVLSVALPKTYFEAVKEKGLHVVSRPEIKVISKSPLKFEATVAVLPEVKFKDYAKIKVEAKPVKIEEKEIDEVVEEMRRYRAKMKPLEREVQMGDRVEINFQGFDDGGAPIDRTKSENHPLFIGEGSLVPGFEEKLIGMKIGGKKKFPVKFPKDYHHEPLQSKIVHFEVEIKRGEEAILPELNEDFISNIVGQKKSVPEFRKMLGEDISRRKESEMSRARENELLEKFLKEAECDVPPILAAEECDYMIEELKKEVESRGLKFEDYLKQAKKDEEALRKQFVPEAEKRVKVRLILNFLFKDMNIVVSEAELDEAKKALIGRYPDQERSKLEQEWNARGNMYLRLKNDLMLEKLFKNFLN